MIYQDSAFQFTQPLLRGGKREEMKMNPQFKGMRKLAAQVIILAMHDFDEAKRKLSRANDLHFFDALKQEQYRQHWALEKRYAYRFLVNDSIWHQILDIKPEYIKRKIDDPKFKFNLVLNYDKRIK